MMESEAITLWGMRGILFFVYVSFESFYGAFQWALGLDGMSQVSVHGAYHAAGDPSSAGDPAAEKDRQQGPLALDRLELCGVCDLLYSVVLQQHVRSGVADCFYLADHADRGHFDEPVVLPHCRNAGGAEKDPA